MNILGQTRKALWATATAAVVVFGLGVGSQAWADGSVKIGVGAPFTGPYAVWGEQYKRGVELAVKDFNAKGGADGATLSSEIGDDAGDPKAGVSVANKFLGDGVTWVIGHVHSGVSIAASDVYAENGMIQITPASTNPNFTDRGLWNTFRTTGRDDQQGSVAGRYIVEHFNGKKVAIVHDKTPFGEGLANVVKNTINQLGVQEVMFEGINTGEKDFSALVAKVQNLGVDVFYYGGVYAEAGLIIRQMHDRGLKTKFFGSDGVVTTEFASIAGPGVEGVLMTYTLDPREIPASQEIVERFRDAGFEPEAFTIKSYASVQVLVDSANAIHSTDPMKIAEYMRSGHTFKTVMGDVTFDEKGDMLKSGFVVYEWRKTAAGTFDYAGNVVSE